MARLGWITPLYWRRCEATCAILYQLGDPGYRSRCKIKPGKKDLPSSRATPMPITHFFPPASSQHGEKNIEDWFVRILSILSLSHLGCAFSFSPSLSQDSRCPLSPGAPPWTRGCRASPCWRSPCRPSGGSTRTRLSHSPAPCLSSASCSAESNFHSYPMGEMNLIAICVDVEMKITGKYIADWYLRLLLELLCDPNQKVWSQRIETSYVE